MKAQTKLISAAALGGLLLGFGVGYLLGLKSKDSNYEYEWEDEEDYGDEDEDYPVGGDAYPGSEISYRRGEDSDVPGMKAEKESIK